jgi:hypothetical protein
MKFSPCGLATGIGSLPHTDPQTAVNLVKKYFPFIPHWPQLPRLTSKEFYHTQFLQLLQDLELLCVGKGKTAHFLDEEPDWPERMAAFYELYLQVVEGDSKILDKFSFPPGSAEGFSCFYDEVIEGNLKEAKYLKGQVVGLLTVGFQVTDQNGVPAYYNPQLRDIILKQLSLQAAWQVQNLSKFGHPVIIFMDDPVIDSCGRYDRICVDRGEVQSELSEFAAFVRQQGGLAGVHSCADLDWSLLLETELDIISFDMYQFAESFSLFPEQLQSFMKKGGVVAWGAVPTDGDALVEEDLDSLSKRFFNLLVDLTGKGVAPDLLYSQSLITPSCGAGTLTESQALLIYQLTAELSQRWETITNKITSTA